MNLKVTIFNINWRDLQGWSNLKVFQYLLKFLKWNLKFFSYFEILQWIIYIQQQIQIASNPKVRICKWFLVNPSQGMLLPFCDGSGKCDLNLLNRFQGAYWGIDFVVLFILLFNGWTRENKLGLSCANLSYVKGYSWSYSQR